MRAADDERVLIMMRKWLSTGAILLTLCGGVALGNYAATQGSGTTFGSIVIGGVHFVSSLICDATTANQCAAVSAGGAIKVDGSAVTQPVGNTQASTTSGQSGPLVQCAVTTAAPTYTTAQTDPFSCDTSGNVRVNVTNTNANGQATMANSSPVVIASNQSNVPVINIPTGTSGNALTAVTCGSAVSSCVIKNAAGNFYGVYAECTSACWLMVFNSASAPSNGATTAGTASGNLVECVDIAANSSRSITYPVLSVNYSVGVTAVISSTACATLTLSTVGFIRGTVL
jgi:hypothetical protein